jgi:ceramide kinase
VVFSLIWFQGGDGLFNEILNGFLSSRHKAPYPPGPSDINFPVDGNGSVLIHHGSSETVAETTSQNDDRSPLLSSARQQNGSGLSNSSMYHNHFVSIQTKCGFDCVNYLIYH